MQMMVWGETVKNGDLVLAIHDGRLCSWLPEVWNSITTPAGLVPDAYFAVTLEQVAQSPFFKHEGWEVATDEFPNDKPFRDELLEAVGNLLRERSKTDMTYADSYEFLFKGAGAKVWDALESLVQWAPNEEDE